MIRPRTRRRLSPCLLLFVSFPIAAQLDMAAVEAARESFLDRVVAKHGWDRSEMAAILAGAEIDERVLEAISRPVERVVPWYEYRNIFLTEQRIAAGADFWRAHEATIAATAERHGVDAQILVAIIGVESMFGERMGRYRVLDSLSTLAFAYPRRAAFFSSELESFLLMITEEGPELVDALGSYAGAMGAGQFIPSSFRAYAVDADGDGRRDLWQDWDDVLASVANYFAEHGWRAGEPIIVTATRGADVPAPRNGLDLDTTVAALRESGYSFDPALPGDARARALGFEQDAESYEYWIGLHNFHVITRYNRSEKYALAAYQLGQAILDAYRGTSL